MSLLTPRYWLLWLGISLLWGLTRLPFRWQMKIGRQVGRLGYRLAHRRRRIAEINLTLCFPELDEPQRRQLLKKHFESLGMGLLEMLSAWWLPDAKLKSLGHLQGLKHLQAALAQGKGAILLSAHFTSLEMGARFLTMHTAIHATYRPNENPLIEHLVKKSRENRAEKAIPRNAVREMLRSLKNNKPLWIATDQHFGHKNSVFIDFFGVLAATNTAVSRLSQISGACVIPFFTQRLPHDQGYQVILQPPLANFPSDNVEQDMTRINQLIEEQVRKAPEQYLWVHQRFKDRPQPAEKIYY